MSDSLRVAMCDSLRDTVQREPRLRLGQTPTGVDVVQQIAIVRHFQHKKDLTRRLYQSVETENVRVAESLHGANLAR